MVKGMESMEKINTNIYDIMGQVTNSNLSDDLKEAICYNLERQESEIKSLYFELDKLKNEQVKIGHLEICDGKINKIILVGENLSRY